MAIPLSAGVPYHGRPTDGVANSGMGFTPEIFLREVNIKYYADSQVVKITNSKGNGKIEKVGDTFWLPQRPDIVLTTKSVGQVVTPQMPNSTPVKLQVNRLEGYDFLSWDAQRSQDDIDMGMEGTTDVALSIDGKIQQIMYANLALGTTAGAAYLASLLADPTGASDPTVLAAVKPMCDATNTGATAGAQFKGYNVGSPTAPLTVNGTTSIAFFTCLQSIIAEANKISLAALRDLWVIVPEALRYILLNSDIRKAMEMGPRDESVIRSGNVGKLVDTTIYRSPLLYSLPTALTAGKVVFAIPFGNTDAINYKMQMKSAEKVRYYAGLADEYRGEFLWDFNVVKSSALGIAWVTPGSAST